jgi:hypothetical protein
VVEEEESPRRWILVSHRAAVKSAKHRKHVKVLLRYYARREEKSNFTVNARQTNNTAKQAKLASTRNRAALF